MATKAKKEPKQKRLPGHELPSIPELDNAAEELRLLRSNRIALTEQEAEAAEHVLGLMREHGLTVYEYENHQVTVSALEKVKVRTKKDAENGEAKE